MRNVRDAGGKIFHGHADNNIILLCPEFHHLYLSAGKGFDGACEGIAKQLADFQRRRALRIDGYINAHLVLQEHLAFIKLRIPDPGDGILGSEAAGDQTAQHIGFVPGGSGDNNIRAVNAGFYKRLCVGSVPADAHDIQRILTAIDHFLAAIDDRNVMLFGREPIRQDVAHFSGTDQNNPHSSQILPMVSL